MNSECKRGQQWAEPMGCLRAGPLILALLSGEGCSPPSDRPAPSKPALPPIAAAELPAQELGPDCVRFWPEARFRSYAYDHVVHLASSCHRVASCNVSTNLNPKEVIVAIEPNEELEVVTLRGSSTPDFTPRVQCSRGTR